MNTFPIEKYKFYRHNDTIIAISTYGGKYIKGYAKLNPKDEFNEEFGKHLAAARCNLKIAEKRFRNASSKKAKAAEDYLLAKQHFFDMDDYESDAAKAYEIANRELIDILSNQA